MGPNQSITEYNVDFEQALTDLAGHVTDEQLRKIPALLFGDRHKPAGARRDIQEPRGPMAALA
jgi:hypothetical protein